MDYPWLPKWARTTLHRLAEEGKLSDQERKLFTDGSLKDFWSAADRYVSGYLGPNDDLGGWLIGSILAPLQLHSETGTKDCPSKKTDVRERQRRADTLLDEAAGLASDLIRKLLDLERTTRLRPHPLDDYVNALRDLETDLREYPKTDHLFSDVPGMESQKSSWRDWLREANSNFQDMLRACPGDFQMRETYWIALAQALFGEHVSRDAVKAALSSVNN